jgi:ribosomal protein S18 acetylase RimI-like enzyme
VQGTPVGYLELDSVSTEPGTEIRYLGIVQAFQGRGLGKHLLSIGVERAFHDGATRVWLSTRSTDGAHAIANYTARGFVAYKTEIEPAPLPFPST